MSKIHDDDLILGFDSRTFDSSCLQHSSSDFILEKLLTLILPWLTLDILLASAWSLSSGTWRILLSGSCGETRHGVLESFVEHIFLSENPDYDLHRDDVTWSVFVTCVCRNEFFSSDPIKHQDGYEMKISPDPFFSSASQEDIPESSLYRFSCWLFLISWFTIFFLFLPS